MATSDNVVRAGLTPKLRDVPTLLDMLSYEAGSTSKLLLKAAPFGSEDSGSVLYDPPIGEFAVAMIQLEEGKATTNRLVDGPSVVIVTEGEGTVTSGDEEVVFKRGEVLFVGAGSEVTWKATAKSELFRAFVEAPAS